LVCPSYSEGMPTVILEAMACGLAVIASDVGAVSEQVNQQNGLLIEAGNAKQLEMAIRKFIQMPKDELNLMKENAQQKVRQNFLWNNIMVKTIQEIEHIISNDEKTRIH
jgi:glycosyltransferase involved in cell wall biosynthesis